jgi:catechol 2,3-dioxygenase-like lactoylglutathione lyase family enzyme
MGRIHHIIVCVKDLERARSAYGWLMPQVGFTQRHDFGPATGFSSEGCRLWIRPEDPKYAADTFSKDRVGLCEVAFEAPSREAVDALARALPEHDFQILHAPAEYPYSPGYYSVFFTDPNGIKLEFAYVPSAGHA